MRILYAFPERLPFERARSYQAIRTASALAESGVEVVLMHPPGKVEPFKYYGLRRPDGLSVEQISRALPWPLSGIDSNFLFCKRVIRRMRDLPAFDAVFVRHLKLAALLLRFGERVPMIYEAHEVFSDTAPTHKRARRGVQEQEIVKNAAALVANSGETAKRLTELYGRARRIEIIPNGVDVSETIPAKDWAEARRRIVYAGSLFPWKGVDDLVAAGAWLSGYRVEIIGGDDEEISRLKASVPAGGAEFAFWGRLPHKEVISRLDASCVAVLPNRNDPDSVFTSPIKLFEYMASGCAVVASDLSALREILGENDVAWSQPGNPESLARAILSIASNPAAAEAMGGRLREMSRNYSWSIRGERLKTLFASV